MKEIIRYMHINRKCGSFILFFRIFSVSPPSYHSSNTATNQTINKSVFEKKIDNRIYHKTLFIKTLFGAEVDKISYYHAL
jgi:hypothetical protein